MNNYAPNSPLANMQLDANARRQRKRRWQQRMVRWLGWLVRGWTRNSIYNVEQDWLTSTNHSLEYHDRTKSEAARLKARLDRWTPANR
jgi:hypothetical protein